MFTYKFFLSKGGTLKVRLTNHRKNTEIALVLRMSEAELNDALTTTSRLKLSEKGRYIKNVTEQLEKLQLQLMDEQRWGEDVKVIAELARRAIFGEEKPKEKPLTFVDFFIKIGQTKAKSTDESFKYTLSTMRKYDAKVDLKSFEEVTYAWLSDFEAWMKMHDLSQNTRKIHFGNIRIAMREAYKRELTNNDPFRRFTFRPEKTRKRSIEVEDLRALFAYPVEPFAEIYRDMFKLIFMLIGINTVDLHALKGITKSGRIEYKRAKTGRLYSIKVEPEAMEIIKKYQGLKGLLCIADRWSDSRNFRHQMNASIKRIGIAQGKGVRDKEGEGPFAHLTSYWMRHTWASIARSIGVSKDDISLCLGHGDGNPVTSVYIKEDLGAVDRANRRVLDWVLYGKR